MGEGQPSIPIQIDKNQYKVPADQNPIRGDALRNLAGAGPDYDLWLRGTGQADDRVISPDEVVELKPGMHFYTAKAVITPGDGAC